MTRPPKWLAVLVFGLNFVTAAAFARRTDAAATPEEVRFFEEKVRPILVTKCHRCHGESKQQGNLRLDSGAALLAGGESGAVVTPGKPAESLLIDAINYGSYEMPPDGKLSDADIATLTEWVRMGVPWPEEKGRGSVRDKGGITDEDRAYWAFQPVRSVVVPAVEDHGWSRNEVDRFIWERLNTAGLVPRPRADRVVLIRRLFFDLVGLPPSPDTIKAFVEDDSPGAYDELVRKLLDSEHFGEKWARHWLDLVRYAESDGFKQDAYRSNSWPYRDYVIRSFNADKPYDQFIREQLAGDETEHTNLDALAATSYLRHWIYEYNQRDVRTQWSNILNDVTDVTAEVFLGLGVACARCHDHKFDPILRKDYYRLQAFFAPLLPRDDIPFLTGAELQSYQLRRTEWERQTENLRRELEEIEKPIRDQIADGAINKFPPDIRPMIRKPESERSPFEHQIVDLAKRQITEEYSKLDVGAKLKGEQKSRWLDIKKRLGEFESSRPRTPDIALTVTDVGPVAPVSMIPGDRGQQPILPGFLSVLDPSDAVIEAPTSQRSTGRRTVLANWIASSENPLTARVIVNRVWQYHFGQGIVATSSDFGRLGDAPSHPELLDWLAKWFVDNGWSLKKLHQLIVSSATYQQSSNVAESLEPSVVENSEVGLAASASQLVRVSPMNIDPENRLLWHMPVRRLDAEQIRDAALAVSGELDASNGGPSVDASQPRRTIYTKVMRNVRDPLLDAFDAADNFNSTSLRNVTTTPTQSLLMMNGPWLMQRASALATRLEKQTTSHQQMIEQAFLLAYGRSPTAAESSSAVAFLSSADANNPDSSALREATASFAPFPGREGMALDVKSQNDTGFVSALNSPSLPSEDFTVEAFVLLRSLYDDASVRTIASQWDGDNQHAGWSLGVTSKRSRYEPRNLILQLVGGTKDAKAYEVIASNLRLELNRPYYVAVSVHIADGSAKGVRFFLRDLADERAPLQTANVSHKVIKDYRSKCDMVIGGRDGSARHRWDGLIDDVRLSSTVLSVERLQFQQSSVHEQLVGWWRFRSGWRRVSRYDEFEQSLDLPIARTFSGVRPPHCPRGFLPRVAQFERIFVFGLAMSTSPQIRDVHPHFQWNLTRRDMLVHGGGGFGALALAYLLGRDFACAATPDENRRAPHHPATAKSMIFLFMEGGPSHIDLFDPKPKLNELAGQPLPESFGPVITPMGEYDAPLLASKRQWKQHGESGIWVSDWLPHTAECVDDLAVIRSCWGNGLNHSNGVCQMNTGSILGGRPSLGAWVSYGLGTENENLPAFVVMEDTPGKVINGPRNWSAGFMPATYQGTAFFSGEDPIQNLDAPAGISVERQRVKLELLTELNRQHAAARREQTQLDARIRSYELAFRMQANAPEAVDLDSETVETRHLYGMDNQETATMGRMCLLSRRLVERGVRFVQLYHGSGSKWDAHSGIEKNHSELCRQMDKPVAGLIQDLKRRGLLSQTLVVWGGEFGRTPMSEKGDGRDHNPYGFTMWMAGGGVKGGQVIGSTDEIGLHAVQDRLHIHDLHATMLHLMGLHHMRLVYRHKGRPERPTLNEGEAFERITTG